MEPVTLTLCCARPTAVTATPRVLRVAAMFGLGVDEQREVAVVRPTELSLAPGEIFFITGPSGSGKSTLLRLIAHALRDRRDVQLIDFNHLPPLPETALVDALTELGGHYSIFVENRVMPNDGAATAAATMTMTAATTTAATTTTTMPATMTMTMTMTAAADGSRGAEEMARAGEAEDERDGLERVMRLLAMAGLNDAFVMLRTPGQLSDGQRYRLKLAQAMGMSETRRARPHAPTKTQDESGGKSGGGGDGLTVVLADEFAAALDRVTAKVIAHNVRKWTRRSGVCFIAATTHEDLLEALEPDCVVEQQLGAGLTVARRGGDRLGTPGEAAC